MDFSHVRLKTTSSSTDKTNPTGAKCFDYTILSPWRGFNSPSLDP